MPYVIQLDAETALGNVFSVGDAGLASTDAIGEAAAADHTATKPSLILVNPTNSGYDCYLLKVQLTQSGTVAGGRPEAMLAYDSGNRYSSGGAAKTPVNRKANGRVSNMSVYQAQNAALLTASAATAFVKYLDQREFLQSVTAVVEPEVSTYDLAGSLIIPEGWSFMLFLRAATTGLTFHWNLDFLEKAVAA